MCLAPITLSTKSGHVQACRLVHGLYMANLTKCFDMELGQFRFEHNIGWRVFEQWITVLCVIFTYSYI